VYRPGAESSRRGVQAQARGFRIDPTAAEPERGALTSAPATDSFGLTSLEREVLAFVCAGWSDRQIAEKLPMTELHANFCVARILQKLDVSTREQGAAVAIRLRLVDQPTVE
jgi:DNA-binding NarL/FixJ family response regulator